jgi:hypothetical protein
VTSSTPIGSSRPGSDVAALHLGDEIREQVSEIVDPQAQEPFGVYVWADPNPATELARHVERVVFDESFGNSPEQLDLEYGKYEAASLFICVVDHSRRLPVGMARTILPSDAGLKSLNDLEREWEEDVEDVLTRTGLPVQPELMWDCATLATLPEYRGGDTQGVIGMALYQTLATAGLRCGFRYLVAVIDVPVLRVIQWRIGRPFQPYEGVPALPYLGSTASMPVWTDLPVWSARLASSNPVKHDIVCGGHGVEGLVAPPDWDMVDELAGSAERRLLMRPESPPPA